MPTPRSRRALLTSAVPLSLSLTGCFEGGLTSADQPATDDDESAAYDCADVERPDPETSTPDVDLPTETYPSPSASALEDAVQYVLEFEETYRWNALLERVGTDARAVDVQPEVWEEDRLEEAVLVSVVYRLESAVGRHDDRREYGTRVTYYVDERVVLRSRYGGLASEPTFEPDPREAGNLVACVE